MKLIPITSYDKNMFATFTSIEHDYGKDIIFDIRDDLSFPTPLSDNFKGVIRGNDHIIHTYNGYLFKDAEECTIEGVNLDGTLIYQTSKSCVYSNIKEVGLSTTNVFGQIIDSCSLYNINISDPFYCIPINLESGDLASGSLCGIMLGDTYIDGLNINVTSPRIKDQESNAVYKYKMWYGGVTGLLKGSLTVKNISLKGDFSYICDPTSVSVTHKQAVFDNVNMAGIVGLMKNSMLSVDNYTFITEISYTSVRTLSAIIYNASESKVTVSKANIAIRTLNAYNRLVTTGGYSSIVTGGIGVANKSTLNFDRVMVGLTQSPSFSVGGILPDTYPNGLPMHDLIYSSTHLCLSEDNTVVFNNCVGYVTHSIVQGTDIAPAKSTIYHSPAGGQVDWNAFPSYYLKENKSDATYVLDDCYLATLTNRYPDGSERNNTYLYYTYTCAECHLFVLPNNMENTSVTYTNCEGIVAYLRDLYYEKDKMQATTTIFPHVKCPVGVKQTSYNICAFVVDKTYSTNLRETFAKHSFSVDVGEDWKMSSKGCISLSSESDKYSRQITDKGITYYSKAVDNIEMDIDKPSTTSYGEDIPMTPSFCYDYFYPKNQIGGGGSFNSQMNGIAKYPIGQFFPSLQVTMPVGPPVDTSSLDFKEEIKLIQPFMIPQKNDLVVFSFYKFNNLSKKTRLLMTLKGKDTTTANDTDMIFSIDGEFNVPSFLTIDDVPIGVPILAEWRNEKDFGDLKELDITIDVIEE